MDTDKIVRLTILIRAIRENPRPITWSLIARGSDSSKQKNKEAAHAQRERLPVNCWDWPEADCVPS